VAAAGGCRSTLAVSVLVVSELFNALNCVSNRSLLARPPWSNRPLMGAVAASLALHCALLYAPPMQAAFHTVPLNAAEWTAVVLVRTLIMLHIVRGASFAESVLSHRSTGSLKHQLLSLRDVVCDVGERTGDTARRGGEGVQRSPSHPASPLTRGPTRDTV
jgi:hypothetical protein